jgi:hypothetical protein
VFEACTACGSVVLVCEELATVFANPLSCASRSGPDAKRSLRYVPCVETLSDGRVPPGDVRRDSSDWFQPGEYV